MVLLLLRNDILVVIDQRCLPSVRLQEQGSEDSGDGLLQKDMTLPLWK